jgi:hypothetical protein
MTDPTPTRVIMYSLTVGKPGDITRIAEFRYHPDTGVTFTELHPRNRPAKMIYEHGVNSLTQDHMVPATDGPAFMRALLEPSRTTYYGFLDESHQPHI